MKRKSLFTVIFNQRLFSIPFCLRFIFGIHTRISFYKYWIKIRTYKAMQIQGLAVADLPVIKIKELFGQTPTSFLSNLETQVFLHTSVSRMVFLIPATASYYKSWWKYNSTVIWRNKTLINKVRLRYGLKDLLLSTRDS